MQKDNPERPRFFQASVSLPIPEREVKQIEDEAEFQRRLFIIKDECNAALHEIRELEENPEHSLDMIRRYGHIAQFSKNFSLIFRDFDFILTNPKDREKVFSDGGFLADFKDLIERVETSEAIKNLSREIEKMESMQGQSLDLDKYGKFVYRVVATLPSMLSKAKSFLQELKD